MKNPFRGIVDQITENNRIMEQWMAGYSTGGEQQRSYEDAWAPTTDIFLRDNGDLVVLAELPGVRREEVDLSLSDGDLTIFGEKEGQEEGARYYTAERYTGSFRRHISLPHGLEEDRISAAFEGCTLKIVIHDYSDLLEEKQLDIETPED
jgi:HSP20 family protein